MTGGTASAAKAIAQTVGIHPSWVWAELLPDDKLKLVKELKSEYGPIAMV